LRNPCPAGAHWLVVDVRQPGARVRAGSQWRLVSSASGYSSSYAGPQHFGLGGETKTDVEIVWPGGRRKVLRSVDADRTLKVEP
jgi:hypothetical protein